MKTPKLLLGVGSLLSCALLSCNAYAQLSYSVSADSSQTPSFGWGFGAQWQWNSGYLPLPGGTTIGPTPLQIDISLSQNLTINHVNGGWMEFGWSLAGLNPSISPGGDAGTVSMELLENGTVVSPEFGFDALNPFSAPITGYSLLTIAWGSTAYTYFSDPIDPISGVSELTETTPNLPNSLVFNGVDVFISDSNPESLTDVNVAVATLGINGGPPVPDTCNTLALLLSGLVAMFGCGHRKMKALRIRL